MAEPRVSRIRLEYRAVPVRADLRSITPPGFVRKHPFLKASDFAWVSVYLTRDELCALSPTENHHLVNYRITAQQKIEPTQDAPLYLLNTLV
jgi:hypothetical protein